MLSHPLYLLDEQNLGAGATEKPARGEGSAGPDASYARGGERNGVDHERRAGADCKC